MLVLATVICIVLVIYGTVGQMKYEKEMEEEIRELERRNRDLEKAVIDMFIENTRLGVSKGL